MATETDNAQQTANRLNLGAHEFLITATDEEGREGRWVVRRPTMKDELRIGVQYAALKTPEDVALPVEVEPTYDNLAFMVATLNVVINQRPVWFPKEAGDCCDAVLLAELFEKYCEWKECFRRPVSGAEGDHRRPAESA